MIIGEKSYRQVKKCYFICRLQYGMSLAKRKSRDEFASKTLDSVGSVGKTFFAGIKMAKLDKAILPFKLIEAGWDILMAGTKIGTEMVQHGQNVKFNIGKMLGKKYEKVNKSILNSVLKRYTGISSADYLPDIARIFMSINVVTVGDGFGIVYEVIRCGVCRQSRDGGAGYAAVAGRIVCLFSGGAPPDACQGQRTPRYQGPLPSVA